MVKHPREFGFKLGLKTRIGVPPGKPKYEPEGLRVRDVVYVALLTENSGPLEKGDALKIGETGKTLKNRWDGIVGIFGDRHLKRNEQHDRERFLHACGMESPEEVANGKEVFVWMKKAERIEIPYAKGLTQSLFSSRCAEEEFLDEYYEPKLPPRRPRRPRRPRTTRTYIARADLAASPAITNGQGRSIFETLIAHPNITLEALCGLLTAGQLHIRPTVTVMDCVKAHLREFRRFSVVETTETETQ